MLSQEIRRGEVRNLLIADGTAKDISGNVGTFWNNGLTFGNDYLGRANRALYGNGTSQNASLGNIGDSFITGANGAFTASFAVIESSAVPDGTILAKHQNSNNFRSFFISLAYGAIAAIFYNAGATSSSSDIIRIAYNLGSNTYGIRRRISVVYDNTQTLANKIKLYVNGADVGATVTLTGTFTGLGSTSQSMKLFSRSGDAQWFNGIMDKFLLTNVALLPSEIAQLHRQWEV